MKDNYLFIKVSLEEKEKIKQGARGLGMNLSQYVRYTALKEARRKLGKTEEGIDIVNIL